MKRKVQLFLIIMAFSLLILIIHLYNNEKELKDRNSQFSTFTLAVCEKGNNSVICKDELFVNCNGNISKALDAVECNGVRLDVPQITGFAVFDKDWEDT